MPLIPDRMAVVSPLLVAALTLVALAPAHAQASDPGGSNFSVYCDSFESSASVAGWDKRSAQDGAPFLPSCLMTSDRTNTHYQCSCDSESPLEGGSFATSELFEPEASDWTKAEALERSCKRIYHSVCGLSATQIVTECGSKTRYHDCEITANPAKLGINGYLELDINCDWDETRWGLRFRSPEPFRFSKSHSADLCEELVERRNPDHIPRDLMDNFYGVKPDKLRVTCEKDRKEDGRASDACAVLVDEHGAKSACTCNIGTLSEDYRGLVEALVPMDIPAMHTLCRQEVAKCQELPLGGFWPCSVTAAQGPSSWLYLGLVFVAGLGWRRRQALPE